MTRIVILTPEEKRLFSSPPVFNSNDRKKYFSFPVGILKIVNSLTKPQNRLFFLVTYGYFKATHKFYNKQLHTKDVMYIAEYLHFAEKIDTKTYKTRTYSDHKKIILAYLGYKKFDTVAIALVSLQLQPLLRSHMRPQAMLQQTCEMLTKQKREIPGYHTIMRIITNEMKKHQEILTKTIQKGITKRNKVLLNTLVQKAGNRYRLTLLKHFSQSTRPTKIKENIEDLKVLRDLFQKVESIVRTLQLTHEGIRYYAYTTIKSRILQVTRRSDQDRYLYLITFIVHQYYMLQDVLFDILILAVQATRNKAAMQHQETVFAMRKTKTQAIDHMITDLKKQQELVKEIRSIIDASGLTNEQKVKRLEALLVAKPVPNESIDNTLNMLQQESSHLTHDTDYYNILEANSLKLQNKVSEIVKHVVFDEASSQKDITLAIAFYKLHDGNITQHAPLAFLDEEERAVIFDSQGKLRISLYKALLFVHISTLIKSGGLNLTHSYKYKAFDAYLLSQETWEKQKETLLSSDVSDNLKTTDMLTHLLGTNYEQTNMHIKNGDNQYIRIKDGRFYLKTPKIEKVDEDEDTTIADVFPKARSVPLLSVLTTVNSATNFVDSFTHFQQKHIGIKPQAKAFYAGIIGLGCNIGTSQIAQTARHINENELENTVNWYFSVENLMAVNDAILAFIDRLAVPKLFKKDQTKTHTSSDGQKFAIGVDSLNANHSYKYFGSGKGVSVYSFIDDTHSLFYSTVISSSEREAAYVIDGLLHNDVVKSDIHSTDTHGYSEIIFAITYLLGFSFAPRIKNLADQRLYGFDKRKVYEEKGYKILPDGVVNTEIITQEWDQILRLIATLKLKETTASQLLKRLSSYSRQHPLYRALKAFGQIIKSIYILTYLNDVTLRQTIEKQLNKMESANKLAKAVFYGNNQEFTQATKEEQLIAEGCKRLIENAIICWNYLYLSEKLAAIQTVEEQKKLIARIKQGSIITWQHINLHGEFDFSEENMSNITQFHLPKILELKLS